MIKTINNWTLLVVVYTFRITDWFKIIKAD